MLNPTPRDRLLDSEGRPTFLWDCDLRYDELLARLSDPDPEIRAYWVGTVMRQARPDDALTLVPATEMRRLWPEVSRFLGEERAFWSWILPELERRGQ